MSLINSLARIRGADLPVFSTSDVAALCDANANHASKILTRLSAAGFVTKLRGSYWTLNENRDPAAIAPYLAAGQPSYLSLQSALFRHGMISQIPATHYCVTTGPTKKVTTTAGLFSLHQMQPDFVFSDFDEGGKVWDAIASPEKALLDIFYLSTSKTRLFRQLPEVELPENFSLEKLQNIVKILPSPRRRTLIQRRLDDFMAKFA